MSLPADATPPEEGGRIHRAVRAAHHTHTHPLTHAEEEAPALNTYIPSKAPQGSALARTLPGMPSDAVAEAFRTLLAQYDDPTREGLRDTPARMARMYAELLVPEPFTFTTFAAEGADALVLVRDIPFYTLCEHHLAPFFGTATVAYLPNQRIAGLSKLARAVDYFAHALQTQERLTNQVADFLVEQLAPLGVGVVVQATHLCMAMRGVEKVGASTVTSALRGALREDSQARGEFLALAYASGSTSASGR